MLMKRRSKTYVKSPVASLCFDCSSVRKRVSVTISVLIFSWATGAAPPLFCDISGTCMLKMDLCSQVEGRAV